MPTAKPTHAALLDLLVSKAKGLRDAGILRVELDGCKFELAPSDEPIAAPRHGLAPDEVPMVEEPDALNDPATYARSDGQVPGFRRRRSDEGDIS